MSDERDRLQEIASVFGIEPTGADMAGLTGLSSAALARITGRTRSATASPHLAVVAAVAGELRALLEGAAGILDPEGARKWLHHGTVRLAGREYRPIDALADEQLALALLADLRHSNAR